MSNPQTRLNVNINVQTRAALELFAARHDVSITEALRKLVGVGALINDEVEDGREILLRGEDGTKRVRLVYLVGH